VNTVSWTTDGPVNDRLRAFDDVVAWGLAAGVLSRAEAARLHEGAAASPIRAGEAHGHALAIRCVLKDALSALAARRLPLAATTRAFDEAVRDAGARLGVTWRGKRAWRIDDDGLSPVSHRVVWAAAQLATSADAEQVGRCDNPECGWLYLDTTKNHSRRWCSMRDCGSKAKARRYYRRIKRRRKAS
jgi:predicted RNA-binding Zn ribbon-like protein